MLGPPAHLCGLDQNRQWLCTRRRGLGRGLISDNASAGQFRRVADGVPRFNLANTLCPLWDRRFDLGSKAVVSAGRVHSPTRALGTTASVPLLRAPPVVRSAGPQREDRRPFCRGSPNAQLLQGHQQPLLPPGFPQVCAVLAWRTPGRHAAMHAAWSQTARLAGEYARIHSCGRVHSNGIITPRHA